MEEVRNYIQFDSSVSPGSSWKVLTHPTRGRLPPRPYYDPTILYAIRFTNDSRY